MPSIAASFSHPARPLNVATAMRALAVTLLLGLQLVRPDGVVLGFEAQPRDDLPEPLERYPYDLEGKQRSIVLLRRPP